MWAYAVRLHSDQYNDAQSEDPTGDHPSLPAEMLKRSENDGGGEIGEHVIRRSISAMYLGTQPPNPALSHVSLINARIFQGRQTPSVLQT